MDSPTTPSERPTIPRSRLRRLAASTGRIAFLTWAGIVLLLYALQTRLIFPGAATQNTPEAAFETPRSVERLTLTTSSGEKVVAVFGSALTSQGTPHPDARDRPTLLYFYGNGTHLARTVEWELNAFRRLGVNVMIPDYLGYGLSGGRPGEAACFATADACYEYLVSRSDVDPHKIVAGGQSLGGGVAIDLAARKPLAGLVAFCTFTRMGDMARRRFPFLPTSILLRHRFDSLDKIGLVRCPILLGHGNRDELVPADMSQTLAAAAMSPVTSFVVDGAGHNDFYLVDRKLVLEKLGAFLNGVADAPEVSGER
jgi:uncharacterized protein